MRSFPFNRNVMLSFAAIFLRGMGQSIFAVIFNLYILALGMNEEMLGTILSAGSYAQALGSVPIGLFLEQVGFKYTFIAVYGSTGVAQFLQATLTYAPLLFAAAFVGGLGFAGDMVARLPFLAANTGERERTSAFSTSFVIHSVSLAVGGLLAAVLPNLFLIYTTDLVVVYRFTLLVAGALTMAAVLPSAMLARQPGRPRFSGAALRPYLHGMDKMTFQQTLVALIVGLSTGIIVPYFNLYFINYLGVSRELYSAVVVLSIVPNFIAIGLGPRVAYRLGTINTVTTLRALMLPALIVMGITRNPWLAALGYWMQYALFVMAQPLLFSFAMSASTEERKVAASAWMNVAHWLGLALATPVGGWLLAASLYEVPLYGSGLLMLIAALLGHLFFRGGDGASAPTADMRPERAH